MNQRPLWTLAGCLLSVLVAPAALAAPANAPATTPAPAATPLTLAQVLRAAQDNLEVSLARQALASARADVQAADRAPTPVLSAKTASIDLQNGVGPGNVWRDKRIDKSLGVDWTWERGNKRELRTRVAERAATAAQLDLDDARLQQQIAAAGAYYDLLAAQQRLAHVEAMAQSAAQLADSAERRLKAGDLSAQDTSRTAIEGERARADLRAAQADRQRAVLALARLTGLAGDLQAQDAWPALVSTPAAAAAAASSASASAASAAASTTSTTLAPDLTAINEALARRPDVQAAEQRVQAAQAALDGALALRRNDLTLGTSVDHYPGTSTRLLEFRVSVPLAGVAGTYGYEGEIARATAQLQQARDQLELTRRDALTDLMRLQQDLAAAAERARRYDATIVPRARQVADGAELAFRKGALSLTELLDARRTLRSVLLEDLAARAEHARVLGAWQLRTAPRP